MSFAEEQLAAGVTYEETIRTMVGAVLAMPEFLYFYETPGGTSADRAVSGREPVTDFELATRLVPVFLEQHSG